MKKQTHQQLFAQKHYSKWSAEVNLGAIVTN